MKRIKETWTVSARAGIYRVDIWVRNKLLDLSDQGELPVQVEITIRPGMAARENEEGVDGVHSREYPSASDKAGRSRLGRKPARVKRLRRLVIRGK